MGTGFMGNNWDYTSSKVTGYSVASISIWTQEYLFYSLGYNQHYHLFCCLNFSNLVTRSSVSLVLSSLWHTLILFFSFLALSYFLVLQYAPGSISIISAPALDSGISLRKFGFLSWRMLFRNWDLGISYILMSISNNTPWCISLF